MTDAPDPDPVHMAARALINAIEPFIFMEPVTVVGTSYLRDLRDALDDVAGESSDPVDEKQRRADGRARRALELLRHPLAPELFEERERAHEQAERDRRGQ